MIAHVIPYQKTPRGTNYFDYAVPEGMSVQRGDIVWIPLRKQTIPGLVHSVDGVAAKKNIKLIEELYPADYWQSEDRMQLLQWFASWYGVSLPTAWKTMQFPLLKRPKKVALPLTRGSTPMEGVEVQPLTQDSVLLTNKRETTIADYNSLIAGIHTHALIITPEYQDVTELKNTLCHPRIIAFESDPSPSQVYHLIEELKQIKEPVVVIGTKKLVFLPIDWEVIILDQEESKSHKQYDANPRYHVRSVMGRLNALKVYSSIAPSMTLGRRIEEKKSVVLDKRDAWDINRITVINMNEEYEKKNYTWFSDELQTHIERAKKSFLFFNRVGEYKIAVCRDCDTLLPIKSIECTSCGGTNIQFRGKGVEVLEQEIRTLFPKKRIVRIDRTVDIEESDKKKLEQAEIIIGTEKAFRHVDIESMDMIGVLSVDHLLLYPHFQSNERVWQLLSYLCSAGPPIIIQTHSPSNPVIAHAKKNSVFEFIQEELSMRKMLKLPPYYPSIRLIDTEKNTSTTLRTSVDIHTLDESLLIDRNE